DSIVTRAGASTLSEIAALKTPALLIPLDSAAHDHQRANAQVFESAGAALVLDPANLTQNLFENNVRRLVLDEEAREHMVSNLAAIDYPSAARQIVQIVLQVASGFAPTKP
ncbi:MAG: glycosyltransferase, partial [Patescibacteria group bacterium]